jgi:hypothetical protein
MGALYEDKQEKLEEAVVLSFDTHHARSVRIKVQSIALHLDVTENKVLRILERHARVLPEKCLVCKRCMATHPRCPDCSILLHRDEGHCTPSCITHYKVLNQFES